MSIKKVRLSVTWIAIWAHMTKIPTWSWIWVFTVISRWTWWATNTWRPCKKKKLILNWSDLVWHRIQLFTEQVVQTIGSLWSFGSRWSFLGCTTETWRTWRTFWSWRTFFSCTTNLTQTWKWPTFRGNYIKTTVCQVAKLELYLFNKIPRINISYKLVCFSLPTSEK